MCVGVLQSADGLRVGWFWFDHGTGFGSVMIWLPGCLVTGLFGWLGFGFGDSWFTGFSFVLVKIDRVYTKCDEVGV